jgi:hypothetical protein
VATDLGGVFGTFQWQVKGIADVLANIRDVGARADDAGAKTKEGLERGAKGASALNGGVLSVIQNLAGIGLAANGIKAIAGAFSTLANNVVANNAEFERYQTQLGVMLGGTEQATARIRELAAFGQATPFELPGIIQAEKVLTSFKLTADDVQERLGFDATEIRTIMGDVAAGTGQSFETMAGYLGRFSSGSVGEVLMRMQELGVVTRAELGEMGIQFSKSGEMLTPLNDATNILLTTMKGKFGGMMEAQSQTFEGMISNLQDWAWEAKRVAAEPIFDVLKENLGKLLKVLSSEEAKAQIAALADAFAEHLGRAVDTISSVVGWLGQVDPVALKTGVSLVALGMALPKLVAGFTALKAAFISLTTTMSINPVILAATAIVAAGVAIAGVIDATNKKAEEFEVAQKSQDQVIRDSSKTYEEYVQKKLAWLREESGTSEAEMNNESARMVALRDGALLSEAAWEHYAHGIDYASEAFLRHDTASEGIQVATARLRDQEAQARVTGDELRNEIASMREYAAAQQEMGQQVLGTAFTSDAMIAQMQQERQLVADHEQALADMRAQYAAQEVASDFNYELQRAQALQNHQREREALIAQGKDAELATLDAKFQESEGIAAAQYDVQKQLQQRALLEQEVAQAESYVRQLQEQRDDSIRTLAEEAQKGAKEAGLSGENQKILLDLIYKGGSDRLNTERDHSIAMLQVQKDLAAGNVAAADVTIKAWQATQQATADAADKALAEAQAALAGFKIELPPLPPVNTSAVAGSAGAVGSAAAQATEPATRAAKDVVEDISAAIDEGLEAIAKLAEMDIPDSAEEGGKRFAEWLTATFQVINDAMDGINKDQSKNIERTSKSIGKMMESFQVFIELQDAMANPPDYSKLEAWKFSLSQIVFGIMETAQVVLDELGGGKKGYENVKVLQKTARKMEKMLAMLTLDFSNISDTVPPSAAEWAAWKETTQNATRTIYETVREIHNEIKASTLTQLAEDVEPLKTVLEFMTTSLDEIAVAALPDMGEWKTQFVAAGVAGAEAIQEIVKEIGALRLGHTAEQAGLLSSVLGVMTTDLGTISDEEPPDLTVWKQHFVDTVRVAVEAIEQAQEQMTEEDQIANATKLIDGMTKVLGIMSAALQPPELTRKMGANDWQQWGDALVDATEYATKAINEAADTVDRKALKSADQIQGSMKNVLGILGVDLSKMIPPGVLFEKNLASFLAGLKSTVQNLVPWLKSINESDMGPALEEADKAAGHIKGIMELLGLGDTLSSLAKLGKLNILSPLKRLMSQLKAAMGVVLPELALMQDEFGDAVGNAQAFADSVKAVFESINATAQAISEARKVGGANYSTGATLIAQMRALGGEMGTLPATQGSTAAAAPNITQQITLQFGDITVSDADAFMTTVSQRLSDLRQPLIDMGTLAAARGAV